MNTQTKRLPQLKNAPVSAVLDNDNLPPNLQFLKDEFLKRIKRDHADHLPPGFTDVDVIFTKTHYQIIMRDDSFQAPDLIAYARTRTRKHGPVALVITTDENTGQMMACLMNVADVKGFWLNDRLAIKACIHEMKWRVTQADQSFRYHLEKHSFGIKRSDDAPAKVEEFKTYRCKNLPDLVLTEWMYPTEKRWTLKLKGSPTFQLRTFNPAEGR